MLRLKEWKIALKKSLPRQVVGPWHPSESWGEVPLVPLGQISLARRMTHLQIHIEMTTVWADVEQNLSDIRVGERALQLIRPPRTPHPEHDRDQAQ